jgi:hypothetical protein
VSLCGKKRKLKYASPVVKPKVGRITTMNSKYLNHSYPIYSTPRINPIQMHSFNQAESLAKVEGAKKVEGAAKFLLAGVNISMTTKAKPTQTKF